MHNKGFTLIELLVTISILSVVMALAVITIDRNMFYLEKAADEFAADVRYVQMECMKSETAGYSISIDAANGRYYVYDIHAVKKTVVFDSRYQIEYSNPSGTYISFTHEGSPVNAGTFTITDTKTKETIQVSIVPGTGRTLIKE
jgi:prepilin-type N-terminal cleavage/methylation domain-containing protein